MKRESFIIYKSFYALIKLLKPKERLAMYESLFEYGFNGTIPTFNDDTSMAIWQGIFPQLKANQKRYENGLKGGAPLNNQNALKKQPNYDEENNLNEEIKTTKKQPNENVNVNENENVNENNISKKERKEIEEKDNKCVRESYSSIMEDMALETTVVPVMWEFIQHCQLGKRPITNSKLSDLLIRLDRICGFLENPAKEKIKLLKDAINGGYYNIKE